LIRIEIYGDSTAFLLDPLSSLSSSSSSSCLSLILVCKLSV